MQILQKLSEVIAGICAFCAGVAGVNHLTNIAFVLLFLALAWYLVYLGVKILSLPGE